MCENDDVLGGFGGVLVTDGHAVVTVGPVLQGVNFAVGPGCTLTRSANVWTIWWGDREIGKMLGSMEQAIAVSYLLPVVVHRG